MCFVSRAAVRGAWRHRQILATEATLRLLPRAGAHRPQVRALAVPLGRPFSLGNARVEIFASGAGLGAASLVIDVDALGTRVCYAGAIGPGAELRPCDELVLDATYGATRFPARAEVLEQIRAWGSGVLQIDPLAAIELAVALGRPVAAHPAIRTLLRKARELGATLPAPVADGLVLWPLDRPAPDAARTATASGRAGSTFLWAESAGQDELVAYALATGARRVQLVGEGGEALAALLSERGLEARLVGPPRQLALL